VHLGTSFLPEFHGRMMRKLEFCRDVLTKRLYGAKNFKIK
jgi:hypothetical protein